MQGHLLHDLGLLRLLPCHYHPEKAVPSSPLLHKHPQPPHPHIWIEWWHVIKTLIHLMTLSMRHGCLHQQVWVQHILCYVQLDCSCSSCNVVASAAKAEHGYPVSTVFVAWRKTDRNNEEGAPCFQRWWRLQFPENWPPLICFSMHACANADSHHLFNMLTIWQRWQHWRCYWAYSTTTWHSTSTIIDCKTYQHQNGLCKSSPHGIIHFLGCSNAAQVA